MTMASSLFPGNAKEIDIYSCKKITPSYITFTNTLIGLKITNHILPLSSRLTQF